MMQEMNMVEVEEVSGGIVPVLVYAAGMLVGGSMVAGAYALARWLD